MPDAEAIDATNKLIVDQGIAVFALLLFFITFMVGGFLAYQFLRYMNRESKQQDKILDAWSGLKAELTLSRTANEAIIDRFHREQEADRQQRAAAQLALATNTRVVETQTKAMQVHSNAISALATSVNDHLTASADRDSQTTALFNQIKTSIEQLKRIGNEERDELSALVTRLEQAVEVQEAAQKTAAQASVNAAGALLPLSEGEKTENPNEESSEIPYRVAEPVGGLVPGGSGAGTGAGHRPDAGTTGGGESLGR